MPTVWSGKRRLYLLLLTLAGFGQAASAGFAAHYLLRAFRHTKTNQGWLIAALVAAALLLGLLRMAERVITERLSQDYVHEIRLGLLRRNLQGQMASSLGVAITRTSNDLTSVKNWISMGIAPLVVAVPLLLGALVVLATLDPWLAVGFGATLLVLVGVIVALTPGTYQQTRLVRRTRGRLSAQIADTLLATDAIRSGGGEVRELNRIDRRSRTMIHASIMRARWAGALRGSAAAASGLAAASVIGVGLVTRAPLSTMTAALSLIGYLATPLHDLGRVAEYRQTYRAARRIISPAIEPATEATRPATAEIPSQPKDGKTPNLPAGVLAVQLPGLPPLSAAPGDRVHLDLGDKNLESQVLRSFAGLHPVESGEIQVGPTDFAGANHGRRRRLVGYAAQGLSLGRSAIATHVLYRAPDAPPEAADELLRRVGLDERVADLPKGAKTVLTHGGTPLNVSERARLQVARALLNDPALLVIDHLDGDLGADGCAMLRGVLADYPGIVLIAADLADSVVVPTKRWTATGVHGSSLRSSA